MFLYVFPYHLGNIEGLVIFDHKVTELATLCRAEGEIFPGVRFQISKAIRAGGARRDVWQLDDLTSNNTRFQPISRTIKKDL
jgi:hypothetical protein